MINVYLRASTDEQDAQRAKDTIDLFLAGFNKNATAYFVENASGAKLHRPELMRLLEQSKQGDVLVVEQVDRLTRLEADDWELLKEQIKSKGIHLVSLDLPTSHAVLQQKEGADKSLTSSILATVNNMLLDILAITARKDYEDRRRRQAEGIARAKALGKYKGKQQSPEMVAKCKKALEYVDMGLSKDAASKAVGIGIATLYRFIKESKNGGVE